MALSSWYGVAPAHHFQKEEAETKDSTTEGIPTGALTGASIGHGDGVWRGANGQRGPHEGTGGPAFDRSAIWWAVARKGDVRRRPRTCLFL